MRNGIKGQVFSLCVSEEQSKDIQKAYLVSNMRRENDGVYLRVISDHAPEGAKIVEPQLEEVFLSILRKKVIFMKILYFELRKEFIRKSFFS